MNIDVLIERAKAGDREALGKIVEAYKPFVIKTALGIFITGSDMEDLVQEGCISIINAVNLYDKNKCSNFTSYVTNAVRNNFFYAIRKAARRNYDCSLEAEVSEGVEFMEYLTDDFDIEEDYIQKENIKELKAELKTLSKGQLEFLKVLYNDEGGTIKSRAEELGIKYAALIKRRDKILKKLRRELRGQVQSQKHKK